MWLGYDLFSDNVYPSLVCLSTFSFHFRITLASQYCVECCLFYLDTFLFRYQHIWLYAFILFAPENII
jgi:hypothetical protein